MKKIVITLLLLFTLVIIGSLFVIWYGFKDLWPIINKAPIEIIDANIIKEEIIDIEQEENLEQASSAIEVQGKECTSDIDCLLPGEWAVRSDCPYESHCIDNACTIICPDLFLE